MDTIIGSMPQEQEAPDMALEQHHHMGMQEACERANFHRREAERWTRIGRAHGAALRELNAATPVEEVTPGILQGEHEQKAAYGR